MGGSPQTCVKGHQKGQTVVTMAPPAQAARHARRTRPRPTFAFLGGARLGKKLPYSGVFQEKAEISLCRAMLVTEGVHRAPSL